jgi:hypothetical protein
MTRQPITVRARWAFVALAIIVTVVALRAVHARAEVPWPEPCAPPCSLGR